MEPCPSCFGNNLRPAFMGFGRRCMSCGLLITQRQPPAEPRALDPDAPLVGLRIAVWLVFGGGGLLVALLAACLLGALLASPREQVEAMIGVPLPASAQSIEVAVSGIFGSLPMQSAEYSADVQLRIDHADLPAFLQRLGCPAAEGRRSPMQCNLYFAQGPGGSPPENGTAEERIFWFNTADPQFVQVTIELSAS
jgi:hypothetical protein